jgi:hypothetical protein
VGRRRKGDRVRVWWVDTTEKPTDEPKDVKPHRLWTEGRFLGWFNDPERGRFLRLTTTYDLDDKEWWGAIVIPRGSVRKVESLPPEEPCTKKKK